MESMDCEGVYENLDGRNSSKNALLTEVDGLSAGLDCVGDNESFLNWLGGAWFSMFKDLRPLVMLRCCLW